ncbi:MAG: exonuclease domain-containing protein [Methylosarcina sp.]
MEKRLIFIDTETTGLSPRQGHKIVELAAVETISEKFTGRAFHTYLDPQRDIDFGAMQIHGLSRDFLRGKPIFRDIADTFIDFIRGAELIIHNAQFDTAFIDAELEGSGKPHRLNDLGRVTCSMKLARQYFPGENASLDSLTQRSAVNIVRGKHSALEDARILSEIFFRILSPEHSPGTNSQRKVDDRLHADLKTLQINSTAFISPKMLGMEKVIELVNARKDTFFYRKMHKRIIDHTVVNEKRWKSIPGPLLYAVSDKSGIIRYIGKWVTANAIYNRWIRHNTIHHQESTRNRYISELDSGNGPLSVWSVSVKELRSKLPKHVQMLADREIAEGLEGLWINRWYQQLSWNERRELVPANFDDGSFWQN